jgi:hypothetical protein
MKPLICQSCGFPFSADQRGTNRDQSKNDLYCKSCYKDGKFTDPHLTINELERHLYVMAREHNEISLEEACEIAKSLPDLQRWRMTHIL